MASASATQSEEFVVRAPKKVKRSYGIVKFNPNNKVDFTTAGPIKIERENNLKDYKAAYDMEKEPKFGAGSEFGREEREEARRKKYGIHRRRYNVDDQPWLLKVGSGKATRKFKGTKEGGILENASYYIFTQCADGAFDAFPVSEWHSFNPTIRYNYLNIDEAEEEFSRRDKTLNHFSIMVKKKVKPDAVEDKEEEGEKKKGKKGKGKDFLLTDMDEWAMLSDEENEADSDEERKRSSDSDDDKAAKGAIKSKRIRKDHKTNSGDEAVEESDEADEGREVDYMTDTDSEDDEMYEETGRDKLDKYKQTGVEDEEGLTKIIASGDEEEEEAEKEESENEGSEAEKKEKGSGSSSDSLSDSDSDPEKDVQFASALLMQKKDSSAEKKDKNDKKKKKDKAGGTHKRRNSESSEASNVTSRSATPTIPSQAVKKEAESHVAKRAKMETPPVTGTEGLTEDNVRRYLMRKPMTTAELMKKFKNVGLTKDKLVIIITEILKKLAPEKKKIDGKLYLWIKKAD